MGSRSGITAAGLDLLLARLDPDRERAAQEYEQLRQTLVRFFDWRGIWPSDECADEALDRLAHRLEASTTVEDLRSYAHGIARMILLERRRRPVFDPLDQATDPVAPLASPQDDEHDRVREYLDRCLSGMPADSQSLLLRYYEGERHAKIANRRRLAAALGLSESALRSRVQRLRDRLERCIELHTASAVPRDRGSALS
jgi:DNA-directed RNA polymerase specialized sigma24 family protein